MSLGQSACLCNIYKTKCNTSELRYEKYRNVGGKYFVKIFETRMIDKLCVCVRVCACVFLSIGWILYKQIVSFGVFTWVILIKPNS